MALEKVKELATAVLNLFVAEGETMSEVGNYFTAEMLVANAVKELDADIPNLNEIERKRYATEVENYKVNKLKDPTVQIPDPPKGWKVVADLANWGAYLARTTDPVCAKYTEPEPTGLIAGAIVPPFAAGRYLTIQGDNAPAGYRLTTPDGVLVEKVAIPWFAGVSVEYRKVS